MRIKIVAGGIFDGEGQEIAVGKEFDIADPELNEDGSEVAPHPWAGRFEVISGGTEAKAKGGKKTPASNPVTVKYEAKAKGDGFVIVDGDGKEYGAVLTEADAKDFNGLSDEDKAAFATEHAKA